MNTTHRRILLVVALALILMFAALVPVEQSVSGPCRVESSAVWYITRNGAGQLTTGWERNMLGGQPSDLMLQFEQPDWVSVTLAPAVRQGAVVKKGDTLAWIESREGYGRLRVLEAELERTRNELAALETGARPVDIEVAQQLKHRAQVALHYAQIEYERTALLLDSGFVTLADMQKAKADWDEKTADASYAEANISALLAGSRSQEIAAGRAEVERLERSVETAYHLLGCRESILSPMEGYAELDAVNSDVLLRVVRTDVVVVMARIPEPAGAVINRQKAMTVVLEADTAQRRMVEIEGITYSKTIISGAFVYGFIANKKRTLEVGMTGYAACSIGRHSLLAGAQARLGRLRL